MASAPPITESLSFLFPEKHRQNILKVYQAIPGSLLKFLKQEDIVAVINFEGDLTIEGKLGTEKKKCWDEFTTQLTFELKKKLSSDVSKAVKADEIAEIIGKKYREKVPNWAKRGEKLSEILRFNQTFKTEHSRYINMYVYAHITEECDHNWVYTNQYHYKCTLSIDFKGIIIDEKKAAGFAELVSDDVSAAVTLVKEQAKLGWDEFLKKPSKKN